MSMQLSEIFTGQSQLLDAMDWPCGAPTLVGNQNAAKENLLAAIHECTEAMNELNWKPWKPAHKEVDKKAFATELMDIVQFVANAALVMNLSSHDLEMALRDKWVENHRRVSAKEVTSAS